MVIALQGMMMDLQQNVGAGFFSLLVSARNPTTWYMFVIPKQAVPRYLQALEIAEFLKGIGELFSAFSIHEKHQSYEYCDLSGAIAWVDRCLEVLEKNEASIREMNCRLPLFLKGP